MNTLEKLKGFKALSKQEQQSINGGNFGHCDQHDECPACSRCNFFLRTCYWICLE